MQQVSAPVTQMTQQIPEVPSNIREGYHGKVSTCLGVTQIGIGATCIILQVVLIAMGSRSSVIGHGIWCGIFFIIGGSFGVAAGQTKRRGLIITFMVLSILSAALFIWALIACSALGIVLDGYHWRYSTYHSSTGTYSYITGSFFTVSALRCLNGLLIGLGLLQGIIAIVSSAICCGATCCAGTATGTMYPQGLVRYPHTTGQQVMVMTGMGGQYQIAGQTSQYITHPHSYTVQPGMQAPDQPSASVQQAAVPPQQFCNPPQTDRITPNLPAVNKAAPLDQ